MGPSLSVLTILKSRDSRTRTLLLTSGVMIVAVAKYQQSVAVTRVLHEFPGRNHAARTRLVLDNEGSPRELQARSLGEDAWR